MRTRGLESLLFIFLKKLQEHRARRALILAFDSSFPFAVGERRLTRRAEPFSLWNYDYTRIPSIMEQRASTYQALFFRTLQVEGVIPDDQTIRVVLLRHTDAQWQPDLRDLPEACRQEDPPLASPTAVAERLAEISDELLAGVGVRPPITAGRGRQGGGAAPAGDPDLPARPGDERGGTVRLLTALGLPPHARVICPTPIMPSSG